MVRRDCLKKGQNIYLLEKDTNAKREFIINKKVSDEGASVVCYEAYHKNSGRGILKEFYPVDILGMKRDNNSQLVNSQEYDYEQFKIIELEYLEPYEMLLKAKQRGEDNDLATFIPHFEIYRGCDKDGNGYGTTYIWTPEPQLETFSVICDEIHKHPTVHPEQKLVTVLTAMEALANCICALHSSEMIHRDIKPSNFGFLKQRGKTLTQTLSMFDVNTICSVYGNIRDKVGTEGFIEPEADYETPNNKTDIYSIGATLFYAIIDNDRTKKNKYVYSDEFFEDLPEMVNTSKLIVASEANSHPRLRNVLSRILQKCLCCRENRYDNCEALIKDLNTALYFSLPSEIANKKLSNEKWVLKDIEKSLDKNKEKNSFLTMQYHLYEYPLYMYCQGSVINVLVIGFGNYGQKFLDVCLQIGQMRNKKINVTVVSDNITDKDLYLAERPELDVFFNIDGSLKDFKDKESIYGDVAFEIKELERTNVEKNKDIIQAIMYEHYDHKCPHYVFVALGEDDLNIAAAKACKNAIDVFEMNAVVSYVCEGDSNFTADSYDLKPLFVNRRITDFSFYSEIERMAFNTHLVWEKNLNVDFKRIKSNYKKTYNHDSSVSNVLSIKYKLYSLGIDLNEVGYIEAARKFKKEILGKTNRQIKNELIWVEHRRWTTEKLCLGWQRLKNLNDCISGKTKDEKNKRHVCIVRSEPNQKLSKDFRGNNFDKWDNASNEELSNLDELDRMSVELHRVYNEKAKSVSDSNLLNGNIINEIKYFVDKNKQSFVAFQEWFSCVKDILENYRKKKYDKEKIYQYKGLKDSLVKSLDGLPYENRVSAQEQISAFDTIFYPVWASMEYRVWKQDDVALVDSIPFILTYTEKSYLAIPYVLDNNNDRLLRNDLLFKNLASATLVNPIRIIYLCYLENTHDILMLKESIARSTSFMKNKHFKALVDFVLISDESLSNQINEGLKEEILSLSNNRIKVVKSIISTDMSDSISMLDEYLTKRFKGKSFFAIEKNKAKISGMIEIAGFYKRYPCFSFDSQTMDLTNINKCDMLSYIPRSSYLSASDVLALQCSISESSNNPEFYLDYKTLWRQYQSGVMIWKSLCEALGNYSNTNDVLAVFNRLSKKHKSATKEYYYILPSECARGVSKILNFLKDKKILEAGSRVDGYTTDSCIVTIIDSYEYNSVYDNLFSKVYFLMHPYDIELSLNTGNHDVTVYFNNLVVENLKLPSKNEAEIITLLEFFNGINYIVNLRVSSDNKISFTYARPSIKELMTTAGKILEVFVYHMIKDTGGFNDIASNYEFEWEGTEVKSEIDCVLTKNYRTLFVECKARPNIEQDFYYKLSRITEKFGINTKAVLIIDTQDKDYYDRAPVNAIQRIRGNMVDVITIWKPEEINNIGHTLLRIINDKYSNPDI